MSDLEKLVDIVSDVSKLRGMYDEACTERDRLKAENEKLRSFDWQNAMIDVTTERDRWKQLAEELAEILSRIEKDKRGSLHSFFFSIQLEVRDALSHYRAVLEGK